MTKKGDCENTGTGLYNLHCSKRFDDIDNGINELHKGVVHLRKIITGDPIEHIEGIVPAQARHQAFIDGRTKSIAEEVKDNRTERRSLIASVIAAVAAITAAVVASIG